MSDRPDIQLDGSEGEGGGQVLRTALTLSAITGRSFEIARIREGRDKPGLKAQHLAAVRAAAVLVGAEVEGDELGSRHLRFRPRHPPAAGNYVFEIGTAGSTSLLLHTVAPVLSLAGEPSGVRIRGGTHVRAAPTFHDLVFGWAPLFRALGYPVDVHLAGAGFFPEGGGEIVAVVRPAQPARPFDLRRRGALVEVRVIPILAGLPSSIADALGTAAVARLRRAGVLPVVESMALPTGPSRGAALCIVARYEHVTVTFGALGARGKSSPVVADEAVSAFEEHHASGMALDGHLADQVLLPLALGSAGIQGGPTPIHRFTTSLLTRHLFTQAATIRRFLGVEIAIFGREGDPGDVRVAPAGIGEVVPLLREERGEA